MPNSTVQSLGGRARATQLKKLAYDRYESSPNFCLKCGKKILYILGKRGSQQTRKKKFCNQSCNSSYQNALRPKRVKVPKTSIPRPPSILPSLTKGQLFDMRNGYQSARSSIQAHARSVYFRVTATPICIVCGYTLHVEVAHRKPVSEFGLGVTIAEINAVENLVGLCPTHHWEHDNI